MREETGEVDTLSDLLKEMPGPPGEPLPTGVREEELRAFTERTGIELPDSLVELLRISNGPCVGAGGLFGIRHAWEAQDIEFYYKLYPLWKKRRWIPIAGDGCGNHFIVLTIHNYGPGWPVLFVETTVSSDEPKFIAASDICSFLVFLLAAETSNTVWLFPRDEVLRRDPNIEQYTGIPKPWEVD